MKEKLGISMTAVRPLLWKAILILPKEGLRQ